MGIDSWDQPFHCQCWRRNNGWKEFQKVIELENAGLSIYRHKARFRDENTNTGGLEANDGAYVFQNTRNKTMKPVDFPSILGKMNVNCSRCKELLDQARILLQRIAAFDDNDIMVVCDHCRTKQKPPSPSCCRCFQLIKKFKKDIKQSDRRVTEAEEIKVKQEFDVIRKFIQECENIETKKSKNYIENADVFEKVQQELDIIGKYIQKSVSTKTHETEEDDESKAKMETKGLRKPIQTVIDGDIISQVNEDLYKIKKIIQKSDKTEIFRSKEGIGRKKEKKESDLTENSLPSYKTKQISTVGESDVFGKVTRDLDVIRKFIQKSEKIQTYEAKEDKRTKIEREDSYLNVQKDLDVIRKFVQEAENTEIQKLKEDDWEKSIKDRYLDQKFGQNKIEKSLEKQMGSLEDLDIIGKVKRDFDVVKKFVQNFEKSKSFKTKFNTRKTKQKEKSIKPEKRLEEDLDIFGESGNKELSKSIKKKKDLMSSSLKKYDSDGQLTLLKQKKQHASQKDLTYYFPQRTKKEITDPRAVKSSTELIRSTKRILRSRSEESLFKQEYSNRKTGTEQKIKGKISKQHESRLGWWSDNIDMKEAQDHQSKDVKTDKQLGNAIQDGEYTHDINTKQNQQSQEDKKLTKNIKNSKLEKLQKNEKDPTKKGKLDLQIERDERKQNKKGKLDLQKENDKREQNKKGKLDQTQNEKEEKKKTKKEKLEQQQKQEEEKEQMKKEKAEQLRKEKEEIQENESNKKERKARKREKEKEVWLRKDEDTNNKLKKITKDDFKKEDSGLLAIELLKKKNEIGLLKKQKEKLKGDVDPKDKEQKKSKSKKGTKRDISEKFRQDLSLTRTDIGETTSQLDRMKKQKQKFSLSEFNVSPHDIEAHARHNKYNKNPNCVICMNSDLELDIEILKLKKDSDQVIRIIRGLEVQMCKLPLVEIKEERGIVPTMFKSEDKEESNVLQQTPTLNKRLSKSLKDTKLTEKDPGAMVYALSDRTFIDKGWTMLPTEKVVRKMNVYRMRPAHPEFDWFTHNKNKKIMQYDTGEKLAEFDDDGRGRLYYRFGNLALNYYNCEETNAQQRFVIYSSGEPDERGRSRPITVLASFDYLGNGIVFDHSGKIRLKYNQTEGVVLDKSIGPVSHWKWHTLNDPPVLQQVMIDTHLAHKDPEILKLAGPGENQPTVDNEEMLAIEFDNFIKEKSKKLTQKFKPFQIKMKALKINEHFSLKVLDQASVYLIYRDGSVNLKLNIGMILDHKEIVDTDTADVGDVSNNIERFPALTESLAELQKSVAAARRTELSRLNRDKRLRGPETRISADQLRIASRPLQRPLRPVPSNLSTECECFYKKLSSNNLYYDTNFI